MAIDPKVEEAEEADYRQAVVGQRNSRAFLLAVAHYIAIKDTMPDWLAQEICTGWGRAALAKVVTDAEAALKNCPQT